MYAHYLFGLVSSHSFITYPLPRGNRKTGYAHCSRGEDCSQTCDSNKAQSDFGQPWMQNLQVRRGEELTIKWNRNNHPGGFVRISITDFHQSDDAAAFDYGALQYSCYEHTCQEDQPDINLGEHNGLGNGQCHTKFKIPRWFSDNSIITMQWTWFGGGVYYGNQNAAFADYVNCSDFTVVGGDPLESRPDTFYPEFISGDPGNQATGMCRYWGSNKVDGCPEGFEKGDRNGCGFGPVKNGRPGAQVCLLKRSFK